LELWEDKKETRQNTLQALLTVCCCDLVYTYCLWGRSCPSDSRARG
jgi:hypothetical protein